VFVRYFNHSEKIDFVIIVHWGRLDLSVVFDYSAINYQFD
jgi:hypothetical protein